MNRLRLTLLAVVSVLIGYAGLALADVTVSQSNNPDAVIGSELSRLLSHEKVALNALTDQDIARATRRPSSATGRDFIYSRDYLATLPAADGGKQWHCLAEALYFEARGEAVAGQFAVAEVILNRVDSKSFPSTVCKVVNQGTGERYRCQFTYTCDGLAENISEKAAWRRVGKIARLMLDGAPRALTGGATHYHTTAVKPNWAAKFSKTATIGDHIFYTMTTRQAAKG